MNDTKREKLQIVKIQLKSKNSICKVCLLDTLVFIIPSLTVKEQKNGCKSSKIKACSRFLFRSDMCYCAIFFCLWQIYFFCLLDDASHRRFFDKFIVGSKTESVVQGVGYFGSCVGWNITICCI